VWLSPPRGRTGESGFGQWPRNEAASRGSRRFENEERISHSGDSAGRLRLLTAITGVCEDLASELCTEVASYGVALSGADVDSFLVELTGLIREGLRARDEELRAVWEDQCREDPWSEELHEQELPTASSSSHLTANLRNPYGGPHPRANPTQVPVEVSVVDPGGLRGTDLAPEISQRSGGSGSESHNAGTRGGLGGLVNTDGLPAVDTTVQSQ
jgi:hypothetical protein